MTEVAVSSKKASEAAPISRATEVFRPMFPSGRLFGMSPFALMREFTDEMDRMFRGARGGLQTEEWVPTVDVQQCNGNLVVSAELPGLKKEEVKVELTDDALVIEGERKREHKEDHDGFHRWERSYGHFYRSIPLPEGAKTDQAKAELQEGVLKVSVPVPEMKKKSRRVLIEEGSKSTLANASKELAHAS
jgi:HSP20 family protein